LEFGVDQFVDIVKKDGKMDVTKIIRMEDGSSNIRDIIKLSWLK